MPEPTLQPSLDETVASYRDKLTCLREILFANIVLAGEIPAPTGAEWRITRFLRDRFTESGLSNVSRDQAGNVAGVLPGRLGQRNLLVAAHVDKIWAESDDHTVSVGAGSMSGRSLADNSLGTAVLATLPLILDVLGIELESNLVLLGATRSFGRGDLGGMRFFLDNTEWPFSGALCLEGFDLGRLSYASLGMARGEITVSMRSAQDPTWSDDLSTNAVVNVLATLVNSLAEIHRRENPETRVLIGSIEAGSGHSVPPRHGILRFEVHSPHAKDVARLEAEITKLVTHASTKETKVALEMIAHRRPGDLGSEHPLVLRAQEILSDLKIETHIVPSVSELALLLERGIPALTLGITRGERRHTPSELIWLDPVFDGLAQIVSLLQALDSSEFAS